MFKQALIALSLAASLTMTNGAQAKQEANWDEAPTSDLQNFALTFTDPVDVARSSIKIFSPLGRAIATEPLQTDASGSELIAPIVNPLPPGAYKVIWHVVSKEGLAAEGTTSVTVPESGTTNASLAP